MTEIYLRPHNINASGNIVYDDYRLIDISDDIALPNIYQIIDLTSLQCGPGARMGGGSQSLVFPATKNNNVIFGFIFDINISDCLFDARLKADCIVYQDKIQVAFGVLQLQTIQTTDKKIYYNCQLTFGYTSLISAMTGDSENGSYDFLLSDLYNPSFGDTGNKPWSALDHVLNQTNEENSWTAQMGGTDYGGNGYVYPMIDFGQNDLNGWSVDQLYPAIYVQEYIDRIFDFCGFTYDSIFFGSDFFASLIIPFTNGLLGLSVAEISSREFDVTLSTASTTVTPGNETKVPFDTVVVNPGSMYNTTTHKYTVPTGKTGQYKFVANIKVTWAANSSGRITLKKNGTFLQSQTFGDAIGATNQIVSFSWTSDKAVTVLRGGGIVNINITIEGDYFEIFVQNFSTSAGNISFKSTSEFYNEAINSGITEGEIVNMADAVPQNVLMKDFFISIVKMFNLYVDIDKNTPYNLIIEPRKDFYDDGEIVDWTDKLDLNSDIISTPMGMVNAKNYLFTYSSDSDYWNAYYSNFYYTLDHADIYGERQIGTTNDFQIDNNKTDVIFAPTPLVFYPATPNVQSGTPGTISPNTKILSIIHTGGQNDTINEVLQPVPNCKIRILIYGGLKMGNWVLMHFDATTHNYSSYPYAGHFDDPLNPTVDLNFGLTSILYYDFTAQKVTNNNLYNKYYSDFINEITDPDSKVVEMSLKLAPKDILQLDFRNTTLIQNTYYKLLEITDYDMSCYKLTKCKFLKATSIPGDQIYYGVNLNGGRSAIGGETTPAIINIDNLRGHIKKTAIRDLGGLDNHIGDLANNILITGESNTVANGVNTVTIIGGSGNIVVANNVTLINCSGLTITDDDVVYIDNVLQPGAGTGTVTTVSVATANGFDGTVANPTTTPAITLKTTITGLLKGNGTAISAASSSDVNKLFGHTVFMPTTGGTVNLVVNQDNIINPSGALLALTIVLPSSPNDNDFVNYKFTQPITTITYSGGTIADSITSPVAGSFIRLVFDFASTKWY